MSVELQQIKKSYQSGSEQIEVLRGINAIFTPGQITAIVGQSGSGKSTLLSLLAGLDRPDSGALQIQGQNIVGLTESEMTTFRGKNIGIVFQQFHLLTHLTALENVMIPLEILGIPNAEKLASESLESLGLSHRANHLPSQMSGGECQRVAIARALVVKPQVLLADEPSGNLDITTGQKVMDVFFDVVRKNKITTLLVTHSLELAEKCDRILALQNGILQEKV